MPEPNGTDWILVEGAGNPVVNGYYKPDGLFDGTPKYLRRALWDGYVQDLHIFRAVMRSGDRWWFISIGAPAPFFGTDLDLDFYFFKPEPTLFQGGRFPPQEGWCAKSGKRLILHGIDPPPKMSFIEHVEAKQTQAKIYVERMAFIVDKDPSLTSALRSAHQQFIAFDEFATTIDLEFKKALFKERTVALEMAVWKAVAEKVPRSPKKFRCAIPWAKQGWKEQKRQARRANEIYVVLLCVTPFLEKQWVVEQKKTDNNDRKRKAKKRTLLSLLRGLYG